MAGPDGHGGSAASERGAGKGLSVPCYQTVEHDRMRGDLASDRFFWLDITDPTPEQVRQLGEVFHLHPLALEDTENFDQRPKLEDYGEYVFLVFYGACPKDTTGDDLLQEIHMFVSGSWIITVHRGSVPALDRLRERVDADERKVRSEQFLVYQVLDALTDTFFPLLERIDDEIDEIEDEVISDPDQDNLRRIFGLKRDLVSLRRVITPQRDLFARNIDIIGDLEGLETDERDYFRDVYDHLIRISDLVDSFRDLLSGATDMHLSTVANRQGEVGKQLAMIATIFLPLSFLTGFFGQNFSYLVNNVLNTPASFFGLGLGSMVASAVALMVFFRRRGWL